MINRFFLKNLLLPVSGPAVLPILIPVFYQLINRVKNNPFILKKNNPFKSPGKKELADW